MTPEKFFECWMTGGPAAREAMRSDVAALIRAEREHCIRLIEAPIPGFRELLRIDDKHGIRRATIQTLEAAAKAVRESGEFRDACQLRDTTDKE